MGDVCCKCGVSDILRTLGSESELDQYCLGLPEEPINSRTSILPPSDPSRYGTVATNSWSVPKSILIGYQRGVARSEKKFPHMPRPKFMTNRSCYSSIINGSVAPPLPPTRGGGGGGGGNWCVSYNPRAILRSLVLFCMHNAVQLVAAMFRVARGFNLFIDG